ncbi:hypothetical protein [Fictibacillus phosphorivorans]|uniref:hypothetical protein n=1 Tax=Fictibacillus phosphorivorans TaxID=1221500 RepID=UPI00203A9B13|nr:hypothetical protein [Fictibacillus phosphorivorans]MCM3719201.1 hypothetical protein [Fictibacillus phosphorivorans]MCM3776823.1 hypothetical protein [Fictibacillus phosphorivorans]
MKNVLISVVTLLLMALVNYMLARVVGWNFIDLALFVGLAFVIIIRFFTSTGGMSSNMVRVQTQALTGIKVEEEKQTFNPSYAYYTAIAYTVVSFISVFMYYKDYFI